MQNLQLYTNVLQKSLPTCSYIIAGHMKNVNIYKNLISFVIHYDLYTFSLLYIFKPNTRIKEAFKPCIISEGTITKQKSVFMQKHVEVKKCLTIIMSALYKC